jgi:uncharacterized protein (TIGR03437 family)
MQMQLKKLLYSVLAASLPLMLWARSAGPPPGVTGAPGEQTCTACHRTFELNPPGGSIQIQSAAYRPNQTQTIRVTVQHPEATRWGFELTAREVRDPSRRAGTFTATGDIRVVCANGQAPPCGDALEYASHNANSTMGGANGAKTYEVQWTAPSTDVGDVTFYAAGNAANNSGNNQGDRIYATQLRTQNEGSCALTQKPTLRAVGNAATSEGGMSFNTMISLYGLDFAVSGTARQADAGVIRDNKFPMELACVGVEVAGQRVPVTYVSPGQVNAQVPTINQTGNTPVRLILNPGRPNEIASDIATISMQNFSPAFFLFGGQSIAARVAGANGPLVADPAVVAGARPARPGEVLELYGTGFGETVPGTWQAGEITTGLNRTRTPVTVMVGGIALAPEDVLYAGLVPGSISGLYQLNIRLPATLGAGNVPIRVSMGGVMSPVAVIPVQ